MTTLDLLVQRNHDFAEHGFVADLPMRPTLQTMIISCADPRVDPVHLLELAPGEAVVLRSVGGRVVPITLQLLRMLLQVPTGASPSGGNEEPFNLIVIHHTQCGITRMESNHALMANYFGIAPEDLPAKAILDPRAAVAVDVNVLHATPDLPRNILVSGLVYDPSTGLVEVVVPPALLSEYRGDASAT